MALKITAVKLAPGGVPSFPAIFESGETSQISLWNKLYGKEQTAKLIFVMLEDLNNYFNVVRPMNAHQMTDLAVEMASELWTYRMEEILAFGEAVKKQTYAKIYDRIDPAVIWEQLAHYNQYREEYFYSRTLQYKHNDYREVNEEDAEITERISGISEAIEKIKGGLR